MHINILCLVLYDFAHISNDLQLYLIPFVAMAFLFDIEIMEQFPIYSGDKLNNDRKNCTAIIHIHIHNMAVMCLPLYASTWVSVE